MPTYLIEVPHGDDRVSCQRKAAIFRASGSHFISHADWGCGDGDHKAWMIVEIESKTAALQVLPYVYRSRAKVTRIMKFSREDIQEGVSDYHA